MNNEKKVFAFKLAVGLFPLCEKVEAVERFIEVVRDELDKVLYRGKVPKEGVAAADFVDYEVATLGDSVDGEAHRKGEVHPRRGAPKRGS